MEAFRPCAAYEWRCPSYTGHGFVFWGEGSQGRLREFLFNCIRLSDNHKKTFNKGIKTKSEYEAVATVAQYMMQWKSVVAKVADVFCDSELRGEKILKWGKKSERSFAKRASNIRCFLVCLCKCGVMFRSACTAWHALSCLVHCLLETISCFRSANRFGKL